MLAGTTSEELRGMPAVGVKPPGTKPQRLAALVEHQGDRERVVAVVATAPADGPEVARARAAAVPSQWQFILFGAVGPGLARGARWALDRGLLIQDRDRYSPARFP
ncbi:hypothetical protein [Streptomyces griseorubiginosus]|uniref:hypothetical protein n=1 Tax=Streptomyces griseorubiginosus TaxID=67304 RepID=UPI001AD621E3|nr:hypothetical protein [Streptomyces griseorubiginosus]MBO4257345.1 hypothetical protein [Streptomyces griseorubiginosus]